MLGLVDPEITIMRRLPVVCKQPCLTANVQVVVDSEGGDTTQDAPFVARATMSAEDSNKGEDKPVDSNSTSEEIEMRIKNNMTDPATFPAHWEQLTTPPLYVQELYKDEDIPTDNEEDFEEILDDEWETECDNEKNEQLDLEELWDGLWEARKELKIVEDAKEDSEQ
ncbi:conserved hypothetical protein [Trichinella spiralis]|uniref:hypothetical protein n=1 Tax=Trichinella spiralis TaxID=6334 RepID=UPI0001EFEB1A|nr:conserved hypothetical protein [Trichinella spiralis]